MTPGIIFSLAGLLLVFVIISGTLLLRHKHRPDFRIQNFTEDTRILYLLLWLASLSILAYIVFAFGKR